MAENLEKQSAFVDDSELQGKKITPAPMPETNIGVDTDRAFFENIYRAGTANVLDINAFNSFN